MALWAEHVVVRLAAAIVAASAVTVAKPLEADVAVSHTRGLSWRKETRTDPATDERAGPPAPILATLCQTHTDERVPLGTTEPSLARFDALLADRITGKSIELDPRLVDLLRTLAARYRVGNDAPRIEIVSGFRSPKLNEMLRKKGHHVASHSQHSLGHAVDFRILPADQAARVGTSSGPLGVDPRTIESDIRAHGWQGGVGVYTLKDDWFVHADVGPNRRWLGT